MKHQEEISATYGASSDVKAWKWIKSRIDSGNWEGIRVGDFLELDVTAVRDLGAALGSQETERHAMVIVGIDTCLDAGNEETHGSNSVANLVPIPHHIDFISRDLLNTPVQWNMAATNSGTGSGSADDATDQPYLCSNVYKYLNEQILPTIDAEIRGLFTNKAQALERRGKETEPLKDSTGHHWYDMGKLWLPTEYEVYGAGIFGTLPFSAAQAAQYPYFAGSGKARIKRIGPGGATRGQWWLACAKGADSERACCVAGSGDASCNRVTAKDVHVPICFRIAATPEPEQ